MNLEMLKGLVPWATVKTQIGTRATSRLNPQTVNPKNIIIVANTVREARDLAHQVKAPGNVRAHAIGELHKLAGRVYDIQAIYWHPALTQGQILNASTILIPAMHDAVPLLPENFHPLEHTQP